MKKYRCNNYYLFTANGFYPFILRTSFYIDGELCTMILRCWLFIFVFVILLEVLQITCYKHFAIVKMRLAFFGYNFVNYFTPIKMLLIARFAAWRVLKCALAQLTFFIQFCKHFILFPGCLVYVYKVLKVLIWMFKRLPTSVYSPSAFAPPRCRCPSSTVNGTLIEPVGARRWPVAVVCLWRVNCLNEYNMST